MKLRFMDGNVLGMISDPRVAPMCWNTQTDIFRYLNLRRAG